MRSQVMEATDFFDEANQDRVSDKVRANQRVIIPLMPWTLGCTHRKPGPRLRTNLVGVRLEDHSSVSHQHRVLFRDKT